MLLWICASAVIQQMNKTEKPGNVISKNGLYTIYIKLYIFFFVVVQAILSLPQLSFFFYVCLFTKVILLSTNI